METLSALTVEEQKKTHVSGVLEVLGFNEREVRLKLKNGNGMTFIGEGLKIGGFNKESGNFCLDGKIFTIKYSGVKENLLKKVFK